MPSPGPFLLVLCLLLSQPPSYASRLVPRFQEDLTVTVSPANSSGTTTWQTFDRFLYAERGSNITGMSELKQYLHRFGYFPATPNSTAVFSDAFDDPLESAVSLYQSTLGLPVTGKLDSSTLSLITSPRCAVSDEGIGAQSHGGAHDLRTVRRFNFFPGKPRWGRSRPMTLTYAFSPSDFVDYLSQSDVEAVFRRAFQRWASVIPVNFAEATDYATADIKVGFYSGDHGDGEPFDGVLGVLAHAFSPENGRLHLDAAETWAVDFGNEKSKVAVDLESVATHEIGHVLGLAHTSVKEAVMYPSLSPRTRKVELRVDDVKGVQYLYGSNPSFRFSSLLESDTSSSSSSRNHGSGLNWATTLGFYLRRTCIAVLVGFLCIV